MTQGFHNDHPNNHEMWHLASHMKQHAENMATSNHNDKNAAAAAKIIVVDWGAVISKRSHGDNTRIHGDIPVHYGLEARLLFQQQLLHELLAADMKSNQ